MALLEVSHIEKHFGTTKVLEDISFSLEEGQALAEGSRIATANAAGSDPASSGNSGTDPQEITVQDSIHDGTWQVPYECLEPVAVTKENMDEVITGKYHEESDIYLNVRN